MICQDHSVATSAPAYGRRRLRDEFVGFCVRHDTGWEFLPELALRLRKLIPYDAAFWSGADPATSLASAPVLTENLEGVDCHAFWEREFLVEDVNLFRDLARRTRPVATLNRATDGLPARSARYRDTLLPFGFRDELRAVFRVGRHPWGMVSLCRRDKTFDDADPELVVDLASACGEAFRRAALPRPGSDSPDESGSGLMLFDADGRLDSLNEQAEAWLRELLGGPVQRLNGSDLLLPTGITVVVAHARAIADERERGPARSRVQTANGRWLVLEATPLLDQRGGPPRVALVLQPAGGWELAPLIAEAYGLSRREQEVTRLLARGLSSADIGTELYLSVHTVRDHVKQILEKVGVSSRGELIARLFNDHYLGRMVESVQRRQF